MNIRHFLLYPSLDPKFGGPTYSVPNQCIGTQKAGANMSIVVYQASKPYVRRLEEAGVNTIFIPDSSNNIQTLLDLNLRKYLKYCNDLPDILHFHGVWLPRNFYIAKYGLKHNIPYVINPRGDTEIARINYNTIKKYKKEFVWKLYSKKIVDNAACIIATSEQEYDSLRLLGCKSPIAIIPNGIEVDTFPRKIIHRYNEKKILLFLSRINPIKGIEFLIEAWNKLPISVRTNWELQIVGNSDPKDYVHTLQNKINNLRLENSIKFLGSLTGEAKLQKYQDSDLFVLPTLNENFGNVVAEAMMCECPVITTKNAPWKCIEENECGWWINLTVDDLVKALVEGMSLSDEERYELGNRGRECIINRYSAESVARKTFTLYEWILNQAERPDFVRFYDD